METARNLFPGARAGALRDAESAPGEAESTSGEAIAAVRALNQQYIAAARTNDAEWFRRQVADDAVIVLGGAGDLGAGHAAAGVSGITPA